MRLKKLLAILLITILYAPNAARLVLYTACTWQTNSTQQCDCNFSNIPADQQANFPEKQKELQEQTDWKFLINEKPGCFLPFLHGLKQYPEFTKPNYLFSFANRIFHPPCCITAI